MRKGIKNFFRNFEICAKLPAFFAENFSNFDAGYSILDAETIPKAFGFEAATQMNIARLEGRTKCKSGLFEVRAFKGILSIFSS